MGGAYSIGDTEEVKHVPNSVDARVQELGLILPPPLSAPPGVVLPFAPVHIVGTTAFISGHGPQNADGSISGPFGKVGAGVSVHDGYLAARLVGLSILADLKRALGSLDRIEGWDRVYGMVNSAPDFTRQPEIINGFSDLILDVFGPTVGMHARSAVGVAALPFGGIAVEIEAQVRIRV